ncbi:hypothetical protein B0H13DRAFT_1890577 [Mycena leptocephala]|nr:hypothetical protein B0H13DRAFT_1890577 [Mycena leptocephala]
MPSPKNPPGGSMRRKTNSTKALTGFMFQADPFIVQTSNFGGTGGTVFNDIYDVCEFPSGLHLETCIDNHYPIAQIKISGGWVVDAICTTYPIARTMGPPWPSSAARTSLPRAQIGRWSISVICGFSGMYEYYKQNLLIQLCLVITDTQTGAVRTAGSNLYKPIGGQQGTAEGKFWSVADPMCLAGFHTPGSSQTGISGLSIVKSGMDQ